MLLNIQKTMEILTESLQKSNDCDFMYNGIPIFIVNFNDFTTFTDSMKNGTRLFSRNIMNDSLREYYKKSRDFAFGISYEGVILDLRKIECK